MLQGGYRGITHLDIRMKNLKVLAGSLAVVALLVSGAVKADCGADAVNPQKPGDMVALDTVAPDIILDLRYAGADNFLGRAADGYKAPRCYVTQATAAALATVQNKVKEEGLSLKVFDCYRPQRAVNDFMSWAASDQSSTKAIYFPNVPQTELVASGYIAECSGHSRGSTVDLTLVKPGEGGADKRGCEGHGSDELDMGTGYDCFDPKSQTTNPDVDLRAQRRRLRLASIMERAGFDNYAMEWWHFTLKNEPYPNTYFDFPVE